MPMMHSENIQDSKKLLKFIDRLEETTVDKSSPKIEYLKVFRRFAQQHHDILEKYGRYPYRNKVLDRENTPEELQYLKNADSFGQ